MPPDTAALCRRCPAAYHRRIVNMNTDHPAMVIATVAEVTRVRHVNNSVHESESTSIFLHQRMKRQRGIHVHRPSGTCSAGVDVQRVNKMLDGTAVDQCVEEQRSGGEIDDRRPNNADGTNVAAR